jgi:hypothetical protein
MSRHLDRAGRLLFGSYRRTVLVYVLALMGITVYPVWLTLPDLMVQPLVYVFYLGLTAFVIGLSTLAAKTRQMRLAGCAHDSLRCEDQKTSP